MDVNRDEAIIYEDVLTWLGVKTKTDVYPGMPHIFWSVFTTHSLTKKWWSDTLAGVAWLLGKDTQL
jgi:acetyl esterase/lipase